MKNYFTTTDILEEELLVSTDQERYEHTQNRQQDYLANQLLYWTKNNIIQKSTTVKESTSQTRINEEATVLVPEEYFVEEMYC